MGADGKELDHCTIIERRSTEGNDIAGTNAKEFRHTAVDMNTENTNVLAGIRDSLATRYARPAG